MTATIQDLINADAMTSAALSVLQRQLTLVIQGRRQTRILKAIAAKRATGTALNRNVAVVETLLVQEMNNGRRDILINEYLDLLEIALDIEEE